MTKNVTLNQFFTPSEISTRLVNESFQENPKIIADFASGEGSLLLAAQEKWPLAHLIANDIDASCVDLLHTNLNNKTLYNMDFLSKNFVEKTLTSYHDVDLCIGNPPFQMVENSSISKRLLFSSGLSKYANFKSIPIEILFVLMCFAVTRKGGEIILILPDGLVSGEKWKQFRSFLFDGNHVRKCIELPSGSFTLTEAKTHILIIQKDTRSDYTLLSSLNSDTIKITRDEAIERFDFSYYKSTNKNSMQKRELENIKIIRGKSLQKSLFSDPHVLHTTKLSQGLTIFKAVNIPFDKSKYNSSLAIAEKGDIVLPRVGTRCLGRVGFIESGTFVVSDSLFVIKTRHIQIQKKILAFLQSSSGKELLISISKGVAARHITLFDLERFVKSTVVPTFALAG